MNEFVVTVTSTEWSDRCLVEDKLSYSKQYYELFKNKTVFTDVYVAAILDE